MNELRSLHYQAERHNYHRAPNCILEQLYFKENLQTVNDFSANQLSQNRSNYFRNTYQKSNVKVLLLSIIKGEVDLILQYRCP